MHFTPHLAYLEHEMHQIKSGFCLHLTYPLCLDGKFNRLLTKLEANNKLLKNIENLISLKKPIFIVLEQHYTEKSLSGNETEKVFKGIVVLIYCEIQTSFSISIK